MFTFFFLETMVLIIGFAWLATAGLQHAKKMDAKESKQKVYVPTWREF